jgi:hypothetical protein
MKYLENTGLETMSNFLTGREMGGCILDGRIEAFSCKRAGEDKKLSKLLEAKLVEDLNSIQPAVRQRSTSLGDLNEVSTRRLLIDLISTLNASFPGNTTQPRPIFLNNLCRPRLFDSIPGVFCSTGLEIYASQCEFIFGRIDNKQWLNPGGHVAVHRRSDCLERL